jgi:hypothetical protein
MRYFMLFLGITCSVHADCTASIFPPQTKSLRYLQKTTTNLFESEAELSWSERETRGDRIQWTQTFTVEGREPRRSTSTFRCSSEGITPVAEGTKFTGVQYGNALTPDAAWKWSWKATGIAADYEYRVVGREEVTVPAGEFDAVRVDYTAKALSETRGELPELGGTLWIAEGIGLVKQIEDDPALGLMQEKTTLELIARR